MAEHEGEGEGEPEGGGGEGGGGEPGGEESVAATVTWTPIGEVGVGRATSGVEGNRRFVEGIVELDGDLSETQELNGVALPLAQIGLAEVTDVYQFSVEAGGDVVTAGASVILGGTKAAPTLLLATTDTSDGSVVPLVEDDTPPVAIPVRLYGA
jgi:hypothetical protein